MPSYGSYVRNMIPSPEVILISLVPTKMFCDVNILSSINLS